jgi:hypothetical protein
MGMGTGWDAVLDTGCTPTNTPTSNIVQSMFVITTIYEVDAVSALMLERVGRNVLTASNNLVGIESVEGTHLQQPDSD